MKLLKIKQGQAVWLFEARRQAGPLPVLETCAALAQRYKFAVFPTTSEQANAEETVFRMGQFAGVAIDKLSVFSDGVVVESAADTDHVDAFLDDAMAWFIDEWGYEIMPHPAPRRTHTTVLETYLEVSLERWLEPINGLSKALNSLVDRKDGNQYRPAGIYFNYDDPLNQAHSNSVCKIERKVAKVFDENVYVSVAPLTTRDHLKLLTTLEKLAPKK